MNARVIHAVVVLVGALALGPGPLGAATSLWTNGAGGTFSVAGNWTNGAPGNADNALFTNQGTYAVNFTASAANLDAQFKVSAGAGANLAFNLGGNTWQVNTFADLATGAGTNLVTVGGGTLLVTNGSSAVSLVAGNAATSFTRLVLDSGGRMVVTNGGSVFSVGATAGARAELDLLGGSYASVRSLRLGAGGGTSASIGTVIQSGGTNEMLGGTLLGQGISTTGYYYMAAADALLLSTNSTFSLGSGASSLGRMVISNGTMLAQSITLGAGAGATGQLWIAGGTVLINGGSSQNKGLFLGAGLNAGAEVLLSGGTLGTLAGSNWNTSLAMTLTNTGGGAIRFSPYGTTAITLNGLLGGDGSLIKAEAGTLVLTNANTFSGNTVLQDGQLYLQTRFALQSSTLVMTNAASLRFSNTRTNSLGGLAGTTPFSLTNNLGLAVALYVGANGASTEYSGSLGGGGSLIKEGAGTLNLGGNNSYSGATIVSGGTLRVNGAYTGGGLLSVASNAVLGGTGSLAHVTLSDGARLAPGNSLGTLTVSNLTLPSASLLDFELAATNVSDKVVALGTLTLAPMDFSNFTFTTNAGFGAGSYTLIDAAVFSGSFNAVTNLDFYGYVGVLSLGGADGNDLVLGLAEAIPEPSTVALFGTAALLVLAGSRRRRARK